jgi:hypothetical protein
MQYVTDNEPQNRNYEILATPDQSSRPRTWPSWQTKHTGREGVHMQCICAVVVTADALHQRYGHHDR